MERTHVSIRALVDRIDHGEIKLPEIQRAYVWKPRQVAHLFDSLYHRYPSGAMLLWRPRDSVTERALQTDPPNRSPVSAPQYLLDGQQRLTSLHRVFTSHPDAKVVFHVGDERFQIESAATARDPRWERVADVLTSDRLSGIRRAVMEAVPSLDEDETESRLADVRRIGEYEYYLEILSDLSYDKVSQIFVRVNSGGRVLKTVDLALATLSAKWPGVVGKIDAEMARWHEHWPKIDAAFLVRALAGGVTDTATLPALPNATKEALEQGWEEVCFGVEHLLRLLRENAGIWSSALIPSMNALIPLVVLLGRRKGERLDDPDALIYWLLGVFITARYSAAADTKIAQDSLAARSDEPIRRLYESAGLLGTSLAVTEQQLIGKGAGSPFFLLSYLATKSRGAQDWWYGVGISEAPAGTGFAIEYHHVHPRKTLRELYSKSEINDLANLVFISATANKKISDRSPALYFAELEDPDQLSPHLVPLDADLRTAERYREFVTARRQLLADAMTQLLARHRPDWVAESADAVGEGERSVSMTLYKGANPEIRIEADRAGERYVATAAMSDLERFVTDARSKLASSFQIGPETASTEPEDEDLRVPVGPFELTGSVDDWEQVLRRERAEARPASEAPGSEASPRFEGQREVFPVLDTD